MTRTENTFVIINQVESKQWGCVEEFGPLLHLTFENMKIRGLQMILKCLAEYPTRVKTENSELELAGAEMRKKFEREHKHIGLSLRKEKELWLEHMHFGDRGMIGGGKDEHRILPVSVKQEELFEALLQAFRLAD